MNSGTHGKVLVVCFAILCWSISAWPETPGKVRHRFSFSGAEALSVWSQTDQAALAPGPDHLEIRARGWNSFIYKKVNLAEGYYALSGCGIGNTEVRLYKSMREPLSAFFTVNLSGKVWHTDRRVFKTPAGEFFLAVVANKPDGSAKIKWVEIETASLPAPERPLDISRLAAERPEPSMVRGFTAYHSEKPEYYAEISRWGANCIRMPVVHPIQSIREWKTDPWRVWPELLGRVEQGVKLAQKAGLKVIVCLNCGPISDVEYRSGEFWGHRDLEKNICRAWRELAERLLPQKDVIWAYDLFNEPLDWDQFPNSPKQWRPLAVKIVETIRTVDPDTWILYEVGPGGGYGGFDCLAPLPDYRVIYGGHYYLPHQFTYQGIYTTEGTDLAEAMEKLNVRYPSVIGGVKWDKEEIERRHDIVDRFQREWKVPICIGEFAVARWAPKEDAVRWLQDLVDILEGHHWSWIYHDFNPANRSGHKLPFSLVHDESLWMSGMPLCEPAGEETKRAKVIKRYMRKNHVRD